MKRQVLDYGVRIRMLAVGTLRRRRVRRRVGGSSDYPNSCFGILGDFVVYRDTSTATAGPRADRAGATTSPFGPSVNDRRRTRRSGIVCSSRVAVRARSPTLVVRLTVKVRFTVYSSNGGTNVKTSERCGERDAILVPSALFVLAVLAATVAWIIDPQWIENLEKSPDGGSGESEWWIAVVFAVLAAVSLLVARWRWRAVTVCDAGHGPRDELMFGADLARRLSR